MSKLMKLISIRRELILKCVKDMVKQSKNNALKKIFPLP